MQSKSRKDMHFFHNFNLVSMDTHTLTDALELRPTEEITFILSYHAHAATCYWVEK